MLFRFLSGIQQHCFRGFLNGLEVQMYCAVLAYSRLLVCKMNILWKLKHNLHQETLDTWEIRTSLRAQSNGPHHWQYACTTRANFAQGTVKHLQHWHWSGTMATAAIGVPKGAPHTSDVAILGGREGVPGRGRDGAGSRTNSYSWSLPQPYLEALIPVLAKKWQGSK